MDSLIGDNVSGENKINRAKKKSNESKWGVRYFQALLVFIIMVTMTSIRTSINTAILMMTDNSTNSSNIEVYNWGKEKQGYVISSIYWSNMFSQLLAGFVVSKYGCKMFLLSSVVIIGVVMILVPWSASIGGWQGLCGAMFFQGMCLSFLFPSTYSFISKWAPLNERTRMSVFILTGPYIGMVIAPAICSFIGTSFLGWPWIFYFFGAQALVCGILWFIYGSSSPAECKIISNKERELIEESLNTIESCMPKKTPWKSIFTSVPFYTLLFTHASGMWGFNTIYNETPSFFKHALGLDLKSGGFLTSGIYVIALIFTSITGLVVDYLFNKTRLTHTFIRKLCNTIGTFGAGSCMISLVLIPAEYTTLMIIMVFLMTGLDAVNTCGYFVNHIDLSPRFASIIVGIAGATSDSICLLNPLTSGFIIADDISNLTKWRYVYLIGASMYFLASIVFLIFGSGEKQPWDEYELNKSIDHDDDDVSTELCDKDHKNCICKSKMIT